MNGPGARECLRYQPAALGAESTGRSAFTRPTSSATRFEYALEQLPPPAFTAHGLQSIIQHVAHFPMGSGT